jgi:hypothetical protein
MNIHHIEEYSEFFEKEDLYVGNPFEKKGIFTNPIKLKILKPVKITGLSQSGMIAEVDELRIADFTKHYEVFFSEAAKIPTFYMK